MKRGKETTWWHREWWKGKAFCHWAEKTPEICIKDYCFNRNRNTAKYITAQRQGFFFFFFNHSHKIQMIFSAGGSFPCSDSGTLAPSVLWLLSFQHSFHRWMCSSALGFSHGGNKPINDVSYLCPVSFDTSNYKGGWEIRSSSAPQRKVKQLAEHLASFCHRFKGLKGLISAKNSRKNVLDRKRYMQRLWGKKEVGMSEELK